MSTRESQPIDSRALSKKSQPGRGKKIVILLGCVITLALVLSGYALLRHEQSHTTAEANERLSAIADLKQRQVINWREERLGDAWFLSHAPFVANDVLGLLNVPKAEGNLEPILRWMSLLRNGNGYRSVTIYDVQLQRLVSLPGGESPQVPDRVLVDEVVKNKEPVMGDLERDPQTGLIRIEMLFPIYENPETRAGLLGFGLLELDARQFLFPLIRSWPTPSRTAEAMLVRREGDTVLYLNDLRTRPGTAMNLRKPVTDPQLPAGRYLRGETDTMEGIDYRGVPVVAIGRKIPGTPWAMIVKIDHAELHAPVRRATLWGGAILVVLLLMETLLVTLLWRVRQNELLRRELAFEKEKQSERQAHERELERMNRLYAALSQLNETILRVHSRDELLQRVCRVLVEFGKFEMAWVGWIDADTNRVEPVAQHGSHPEYVDGIVVYADDRPEGRGPIGLAIRQGKVNVCNLLRDPCMGPWLERLKRCGWVAVAAFPVRNEGRVCAALAIYSSDPDHFGTEEVSLLNEAADDISFGLDVMLNTERRRAAEQELRQLNAELEDRVRQRTAALESKNRELESFTYSVSHDLKAPLRGISGFANILLEEYADKFDETGHSLITRIVQSANHMNQLIEDLLSYSRLEIQAPECSLVDVRAITEGVLEDYSAQTAEFHTQVDLDIQGGRLRTDPKGLEQVLRNLIGNAIKFSSKCPIPHVEILGREEPKLFRLEIRDNGIGFDMKQKDKVFQIFQRLHTAQEYPGTGIGLAIVRKAVERVNGTIRVMSEPGKGTTFTIELPQMRQCEGESSC